MSVRSSRVLIIEDNLEMAEVLAAGLQQETLETATLNNGAEALAWLRQQKFDLVLLDLGLPGLDGTEVLRQVKTDPASKHIPVIVMTGRQASSDKLKAFELGAADYVTKPFLITELRARVESILRNKLLQDELAEVNQQLRAKADFLAGTSHEIRTQLGAVTAMADMLFDTPLNDQQREYLQAIRSSGHSLLTLLNDILNVSKIEAGKLELERTPFHLRLCVDEALDLLAAKTSEKNLELLCEIEPGTPEEVIGDANRLRQVLINLVGNAVKFTDAGEVAVHIRARPALELPNTGTPGAATAIWEYHFAVRDTGVGIPPDRLDRLFQSFSQADNTISRQYGGTGLGLYICKGLVELMGGRLWAESTVGQGSTFHFTIPLPTAPNTTPAAWQGPQQRLAGRRVLIVDDTPNCAKLVAGKAERWGMTSRTAHNRQEVLNSLQEDKTIDLAVIDLTMPGVDSAALVREVSQLVAPRKLPMVLLTPMGMRAPGHSVVEEPVVCVNKPVKPAVLHSAFLKVLSGGSAVPEPASSPRFGAPPKLDKTLGTRLPLRILLTDDNLINQKVGGRMLNQLGYAPDIAGSGHETLAAVRRQPYDLIFMDVQMPDVDGLETTRRLRVLEQRLGLAACTVVAMTANAMPGDREKCLAAGMNDYLAKPVQPDQLQRTIEQVGQARCQTTPVPPAPAPTSAQVPPAAADRPGTEQAAPRSAEQAKAAEPSAVTSGTRPAPGTPGIDFSRLLDFAGGSNESLIEIIDLHHRQTSDQLAKIRELVGLDRRTEIGRLAHTMAGASGLCGLHSLSTAARELERACMEGRRDPLPPLCARLDSEFEQARDFLSEKRKLASASV
jgi:CheY-like chemotaxis protein/HPt (histidine-containing phosphotransfer) domain-containing protein